MNQYAELRSFLNSWDVPQVREKPCGWIGLFWDCASGRAVYCVDGQPVAMSAKAYTSDEFFLKYGMLVRWFATWHHISEVGAS